MFISTKETLITNGLMNKIRSEDREPYYVYNVEGLLTHS